MQQTKNIFFIYLLFYFILACYTSYYVPIFESTEARYAEIAREMVVSGNYIEPTFNGIKHFHKPPLAYWLIALGLNIFGINNIGARFFGILASIITVLFTYKLAKIIIKDEEDALFSSYILSSSLLFLAVSRIVSTDIYLTMFTVITQYYYFKQIYTEKSVKNGIMIGLFLGLGFMTKGPIIFLFTIIPFIISKIFLKEFRKVFTLKEIIISTLIFLPIALSWYIIVIIKNPGLLEYFLKVQTVDRISTNRFNREQPFYFFLKTLLIATLPYSILIIIKLKNLINNYKIYMISLIYIIAPFIIFSIAKSKLHTYLAPLLPILMLFTYQFYKNNFTKMFNSSLFYIFFIIPIAINFYLYYFAKFHLNIFMIFITILSLITLYITKKYINDIKFILYASVFLVLIFNLGYYLTDVFQGKLMGFENLVKFINKIDSEKKMEVLCFKRDLPSISFYRNKIAVMAMATKRETQFQKDYEYKKFYIENEDELIEFFNNHKKFFLFTRGKLEEIKKYNIKCEIKYTQRDYILALCSL